MRSPEQIVEFLKEDSQIDAPEFRAAFQVGMLSFHLKEVFSVLQAAYSIEDQDSAMTFVKGMLRWYFEEESDGIICKECGERAKFVTGHNEDFCDECAKDAAVKTHDVAVLLGS